VKLDFFLRILWIQDQPRQSFCIRIHIRIDDDDDDDDYNDNGDGEMVRRDDRVVVCTDGNIKKY